MSYDLILRRQLPRSCARGNETSSPSARPTVIQLVVAGCVLVLPELLRRAEIYQHRRDFSGNLSATQETPAIRMSDLVYGSEEKRS
jgi:hypothetical protein